MAITYEEARELARRQREPGWTFGTFCLDDRQIAENDDFYVFSIGAREFLVDGDGSFAIYGGVTVVYKADGQVGSLPAAVVATDETLRTRPNPNPTLRV